MRPHVFSCSKPVAVLTLLARIRDGCNLKRVTKFIGVWCFWLYVEEQEQPLLSTLITGSLMALDSKRSKTLRTYGGVGIPVLRTFATDEVIAEAYIDVINLRQRFEMTEEASSTVL